MARNDIAALERSAYLARWDDGLFDLYAGLSLTWIGVAWLWLDPVAGFAAVFPAALVAPFIMFRTRFIEDRAGYVRFSDERRRWERRNLVGLLIGGVVLLAVLVGLAVVASDGSAITDVFDDVGPGILAILCAIPVVVIAVVSMLPRLFAYAAILVAGGIGAAVLDTNPGVPLLIAGVVIAAVGTWLVWRFVRDHPRRDGAEASAS